MTNTIPDSEYNELVKVLKPKLKRPKFISVSQGSFGAVFFTLKDTYKYTHLWVWAINSGPHGMWLENGKKAQGKTAYKELFSDPHYNADKFTTYTYPKMKNNHELDTRILKEKFELHSKKIDNRTRYSIYLQGEQSGGKPRFADNGQYTNINNPNLKKEFSAYKEHARPEYSDEFSVFAISFGDKDRPITKPSTIVVQNDSRKTQLKEDVPQYHLEERNYILLNNDEKLKLGSPLDKKAYNREYGEYRNTANYSSMYHQFTKMNKEGIRVFQNISAQDEITNTSIIEEFFITPANGQKLQNDQKPDLMVTSGLHRSHVISTYNDIDTNYHHLKTAINVYNNIPPEVDAHDIVVTDQSSFKIPDGAVIAYEMCFEDGNFAYQDQNYLSNVYLAYIDANPITKRLVDEVRMSDQTMVAENKFIKVKYNDIADINWKLYVNKEKSFERHPEFHISFKSMASDRAPINTMKVIYNDSPVMQGETVVKDFEGIKAYDHNGDFIQAFEVTLADKKMKGKYKVLLGSKDEVLNSHTGMQYSAMDKFRGAIQIVKVDPTDKNTPDFVKIKVRACDQYAWGKARSYHMLVGSE